MRAGDAAARFASWPTWALGTPATTNPLNGSNRPESVSFSEPGTYLVICNVRQHFLNGMFGFVKVVGPDEDLTDDHSHHSHH
jgi:hypothetical protein